MTMDLFTVNIAEMANSMNIVTLYGVWADGVCIITVDLGESMIDHTPSGWSKTSDGQYSIKVSQGATVKDFLEDWPNPYLDGHIFKKWNYDMSSVTEDMIITPEFEVVNQEIVYYIAGGAVGVIALLALISRFEWL